MVESSQQPPNDLLEIVLEKSHYLPGEVVSGVVNKKHGISSIMSSALTLQLEGKEEITFWKKCVTRRRRYLKKLVRSTEIVNIKFELAKFVDDAVPNTALAYPFIIMLPTYLPPSVTLENSKITGLKAQVKYRVIANFVSPDKAGPSKAVDLQILRPHPDTQPKVGSAVF